MKIEQVLPELRNGRHIRRKCWAVGMTEVEIPYLSIEATLADDWELVPLPHKEIDLVEYADGYEFVFGYTNCQIYTSEQGHFQYTYSRTQKSVSGGIYMTEVNAIILVDKLNSGEWVLK